MAATNLIGVDVGGTFTDSSSWTRPPGRCASPRSRPPSATRPRACWRRSREAGVAPGRRSRCSSTARPRRPTRCSSARAPGPGSSRRAGFRDVLELGRRTRPTPYGLKGTFEPLIPRELRLEVPERIDAEGQVVVRRSTRTRCGGRREALRAAGAEALVIHFIHSYVNDRHERARARDRGRRVAERLRHRGLRAAARVSRVRARHDRGHQRLRAADHRPLPAHARRRARRGRATGASCSSCRATAAPCRWTWPRATPSTR